VSELITCTLFYRYIMIKRQELKLIGLLTSAGISRCFFIWLQQPLCPAVGHIQM
jgi:hypothetical protein